MLAQNGTEKRYPSLEGRNLADTVGAASDTAGHAVEWPEDLKKNTVRLEGPDTLAKDTSRLQFPDSIRAGVAVPDSLATDSVQADTVEVSKSVLDYPVEYTASDSVTFEAGLGNANLYGDSKVNYTNLELQADWITMNMDSSIVHAVGRLDSVGNVKGQPVFKQGSDQYEPEKISYNFKTRKAFINNVYTQQGDGFLISNESKRDAEGVMYVRHGKYTTCDAKHPHFYLALTRAKVRPGKDVVFGPAYLVVEDVPLPLAIPYGFFILRVSSCRLSAMRASGDSICAMADTILPSTTSST